MNNKQEEVLRLLVEIFSRVRLNHKLNVYKIKEQFNELSLEDHEWSDIEDHVIEIIKKLEKLNI